MEPGNVKEGKGCTITAIGIIAVLLVLFGLAIGYVLINQKASEEKRADIDTLNIERCLVEIYSQNRNLKNNRVALKEANELLSKQFKENENKDSLLQNIPLRLVSVKERSDRPGEYVAHFYSFRYAMNRNFVSPFADINLDYLAFLSKNEAKNLKENEDYILRTKNVECIEKAEFKEIAGSDERILSHDFGFSSGNYGDITVSLGAMKGKVTAIIPASHDK